MNRAALYGLGLTLALGGCAGDGPRDNGGRLVSLSDGAAIKPEDADLNVGLWIEPHLIRSIERKIRDNVGINETIVLAQTNGPGRGQISSQRIVGAFFNQRTIDDLTNADRFSKYVETGLRNSGYVRQEAPRPVANARSSKTIGFQTVATTSNSKCFIAEVGYRFGKPTIYSNDNNNPDTLLRVGYCQPSDNFPDFETLVSRVALTESTDIAAIRTRLAASPAPARDARPIAVDWSGYDKPVAGTIELEQTRGGGTMRLTLPNNEGFCVGSYQVQANGRGTWQMTCNGGLTASGTMQTHGAGRGSSGEGKDSQGRAIRFTLGAA